MPRPRDADGGKDGVVLNMTLSGDGIWNAIYSVPVFVGQDQQRLMLSVDTGSSDLWLASTACSTSPCSSSHATLYDPSNSIQTGQSVNLTYLRGAASGPIVWDTFKLGPYTIPSQALAAASQVADESLSSDFVGLLGLALPPNSLIAHKILPTESDAPDGATMQENLFGLTPIDVAPAYRFFGISLERPGSSRIPSLLSIGKHPDNLIPGFDPSAVQFMDLTASRAGDTFWRVSLDSLTGWIDGSPKPVSLGTGSVLVDVYSPVAIVDTGGSGILTTRQIANGIYGAWQIGPAQDGNYYVPCTTPINISIGLGQLPPIPLHPLDMTAPPPGSSLSSDSSTCLGLIQASDNLVNTADLVLGIPFLRNVYAILATTSSPNTTATSLPRQASSFPRLGLVPLTDPTTALNEFHNVRVLGQPLDQSGSSRPSSLQVTAEKKLSVGIIVLIAIVGFFVACGALFGVRWWILRRRFKGGDAREGARGNDQTDENVLRQTKWEEAKKKGLLYEESSTGSDWTRVDARLKKEDVEPGAGKERFSTLSQSRSMSSEESALGSVADVGHAASNTVLPVRVEGDGYTDSDNSPWSTLSAFPKHSRAVSELEVGATGLYGVPLLDKGEMTPWSADMATHERMPSSSSYTATVMFQDDRDMAGVGARGSVASSGWSVGRPRVGTVASDASAASGSRVGSRWTGEVGGVMESRRRGVEGEEEWPVEMER